MAIEIELKAWVSNPQELRTKLSSLAVFKGTFEKNDVFFDHVCLEEAKGIPNYGVRVRQETFVYPDGNQKELSLVTYKIKELRDNIEVNEEKEFEVSSGEAFIEFLLHLGFRERIRKQKKGGSYDYNGMNVELTRVEDLGWFIEMEILLSQRDDEKIENERMRLLDFLDRLEIGRNSIESRSYSVMLAENIPQYNSPLNESPRGGAASR